MQQYSMFPYVEVLEETLFLPLSPWKLMEMQEDAAMQTKVCKQKDKRTRSIALANFLQNLLKSSNTYKV